MKKPLVETKLLIKGKLRLRDIEEIMLRLRDEFNITDFKLQIDKEYDNPYSSYYQQIILDPDTTKKSRDKYVWILDVGIPQPFVSKDKALQHIQLLRDKKYITNDEEISIYKKKIIVS